MSVVAACLLSDNDMAFVAKKQDFYRQILESDVKKELDGIYNATEYQEFKSLFKINCQKCGSEAELVTYDEIRCGSEQTGFYGDAGAIIKCSSCGNAIKIMVVNH